MKALPEQHSESCDLSSKARVQFTWLEVGSPFPLSFLVSDTVPTRL